VQCDQLTEAEIEQGIQQTAAALKAEHQYFEFSLTAVVFPLTHWYGIR
jgi:hypothetical protein